MGLIGVPGNVGEICDLCDQRAEFEVTILIRMFDLDPDKSVDIDADLTLCKAHATKMQVEMLKQANPIKLIQI